MATSAKCGVVIAVPTKLSNCSTEARPISKYEPTRLDDGYQPQKFDVFCGSEKDRSFHIGNNRFRLFVDMHVEKYIAAKSRTGKSKVVKEVIDMVHATGGRFIRQAELYEDDASYSSNSKREGGRFQEDDEIVYLDIGMKKTVDKTGHAIRCAASARKGTLHRRRSSASTSSTDSSLSGRSVRSTNMPRCSSTAPLSKDGSDCRMMDRTEKPRRAANEAIDSMDRSPDRDHHCMVFWNMPIANGDNTLRRDESTSQHRGCSSISSASEPVDVFAQFKLRSKEYPPHAISGPTTCDHDDGLTSEGWDVEDYLDITEVEGAAFTFDTATAISNLYPFASKY